MCARIKKTHICSGVNHYLTDTHKTSYYIPRAGDVAIFEVLSIGKHTHIQGEEKRNVTIMPGDHIMAAFGTRYATEQFEGYLPGECLQEFDILGAGGTIGVVHSMHAKFLKTGTTRLRIVAYATTPSGDVINTKDLQQRYQCTFTGQAPHHAKVILSVGASMDSGKTTTAAHLVHGLKQGGATVAFIKLTGTAFTKDKDLAYDMGADIVADFGDMGYPSTFLCDEQELLHLYQSLVQRVMIEEPDYIVMEIADGIYQRETKMLLTNIRFMNTVSQVIFSAGDSLSAINGVQTLVSWCILPFALCGLFTASPLLIKEVKENTNIPVFTLEELRSRGCRLLTTPYVLQEAA